MPRVDATHPELRQAHQDATEQALAGYFQAMSDEVVPNAQLGVFTFDLSRWTPILRGLIFDRAKDTATDFGNILVAELSRSVRFDPDLMDPYLDTVADNSADNINGAIETALFDAVSDDDPGAKVGAIFAGLIAVRAGSYATSMTTGFASFGSHDAAQAVGVGTKAWQVNSGNPRDTHSAMNGQTASLASTFSNGMRWPGDPAGGAAEVANCKCSLAFIN